MQETENCLKWKDKSKSKSEVFQALVNMNNLFIVITVNVRGKLATLAVWTKPNQS